MAKCRVGRLIWWVILPQLWQYTASLTARKPEEMVSGEKLRPDHGGDARQGLFSQGHL